MPASANERVHARLQVTNGFRAGRLDDVQMGGEGGRVRFFAGHERLETFRPQAEDHLASCGVEDLVLAQQFHLHRAAARFAEDERAAVVGDCAADEIHRRAAEESGHMGVDGVAVEFKRRSGLLGRAIAHHRDGTSHGHGLGLVVRDVENRCLQALVQLDQLGAQLTAHFGVEIGKRFIEKKDARLAHDRPSHRNALLLSA